MDKSVFIRDIDDWELYARGLEAHLMMMHEMIGAFIDKYPNEDFASLNDKRVLLICRLNGEINSLLNQSAERSKRLRDIAVGLTDREIDE